MKRYFLLSILFFGFISCAQKEKTAVYKNTNNTACNPCFLVSKMTKIDQKTKNKETIEYHYDSLRRLIQAQYDMYTIYYRYDKNNNPIEIETKFKDYGKYMDMTESFFYTKQNIQKELRIGDAMELISTAYYTINDFGLVNKTKSDQGYSSNNEHDKDGNLIKITYDKKGKCSITEYKYDHRFLWPFINTVGNRPDVIALKNIVIKQIDYNCDNPESKDTTSFTYTYNKEGYPTTIKEQKNKNTKTITYYEYIIK